MSEKSAHKIAVIAGDGIGKEVMPHGVRAVSTAAKKFGIDIDLTEYNWSCDQYDQIGSWMHLTGNNN